MTKTDLVEPATTTAPPRSPRVTLWLLRVGLVVNTPPVAEQAPQAELQLQEERMRIARDLHDVVGHTLSVIAVHGNVAAEAIGHDDAAARRAVRLISDATSAAMRELRATVKGLRTQGIELERGAVGLSAVPQLVRAAREAGVAVDVDLEGTDRRLDGAVDAAGYRIVQESLTNVMRHSGATRAAVRAAVRDGHLQLAVTDDGHGPATDIRPGAGLIGMQERAAVLGGRVWFGASENGGFAVRAMLPLRAQP
jgi:signal transduction histidine kinase